MLLPTLLPLPWEDPGRALHLAGMVFRLILHHSPVRLYVQILYIELSVQVMRIRLHLLELMWMVLLVHWLLIDLELMQSRAL